MLRALIIALVFVFIGFLLLYFWETQSPTNARTQTAAAAIAAPLMMDSFWRGPDSTRIPNSDSGRLILYGRTLIAKTSEFFGPVGSIDHGFNGMNCQNCHLEAGTKPLGNNYGAVFSTYPKYRPRRGHQETIVERINDCFSRSLNGKDLDSNSREMKAILAYMKWVGNAVPKGKIPAGAGIKQPPFLNRPADPIKGRIVFVAQCVRCHGKNGEGSFYPGTLKYKYPPLWGPHSYNTSAGLYRLSRFAGYVKNNMPDGTNYLKTVLADEEAWDVAAFVNSQPRPNKSFKEDWPDISRKPFDHPFGPYTDSFSENQHKYGPFAQIDKEIKERDKKRATGSAGK
jgi:thiosulfate dehydrogenase